MPPVNMVLAFNHAQMYTKYFRLDNIRLVKRMNSLHTCHKLQGALRNAGRFDTLDAKGVSLLQQFFLLIADLCCFRDRDRVFSRR